MSIFFAFITFEKSQRDMAERGHSLESVRASIKARKSDFDAYIGKFVLSLICGISSFEFSSPIGKFTWKTKACLSTDFQNKT